MYGNQNNLNVANDVYQNINEIDEADKQKDINITDDANNDEY